MSIIRNGFESADLDVPVVLPTLNLDFANSQSLDKRITFSRGSIGTRVNKNGLIETIAANQPRFDFDPISGECRGLLIEESRINYWWGTQTGGGGSVTNGTATGADGITAKKFVPTLGSTAFPGLGNYTQYSIPVGSQVTGGTVDISFSGYFAAIGTGLYVPDIVIAIGASGSNYIYAELLPDLTNGSINSKGLVGFSEIIAPQITLMPFGMYKVTWSVRYTQGATIRNTVDFGIQCRRKNSPSGATGTYYADGVNGFQFSCIQYEIGAFPTSYIPTTTSAVTRSVDNVEMTGTNFSSWYNSTEGTLCAAARVNALGGPGFPGIAYVDDGTVNNSMGFYVDDVGSDKIGAEAYISGRAQYTLFSSSATTANKLNKAISSYSINNFSAAFDTSSQIQRDTSGSIPTVNRLRLGALRGGLFPLNGTISRLTYYPKALSPAELQYLTQ